MRRRCELSSASCASHDQSGGESCSRPDDTTQESCPRRESGAGGHMASEIPMLRALAGTTAAFVNESFSGGLMVMNESAIRRYM